MKMRKGKSGPAQSGVLRRKGTRPRSRDVRMAAQALCAAAELVSRSVRQALGPCRPDGRQPGGGRRG
ncbi:MAG: hypothetical protein D6688_00055 [Alphaproteobacteria bacterium]|nr:MAG: hypothetical protein D6688_00055 [Alphaproteobacteria bacterium]